MPPLLSLEIGVGPDYHRFRTAGAQSIERPLPVPGS